MLVIESRVWSWLSVGALVAGVAACEKTPEPTAGGPTPAPTAAATTPQPGPAGGPAGAVTPPAAAPASVVWDDPAAWQKVENPSPMRIATYKIPKVEGDSEDAELSVSQAGGSLEANIERWKGQFTDSPGEPIREDKKVGKYDVTIVEISGTFASGMPGAATEPKTKFTMLAAIVATGGQSHFFKLTGPEKTVASAKADFNKMIDSLREK